MGLAVQAGVPFGGRDGQGEGGCELHAARANEDRALGQVPRLGGVVVHHRHAAAGVGRLQVLVAGGPAGDQDVSVGQLDVAGAEEVPGRVDELFLHRHRVEEERLERPGIEECLIVPGPGHDQYVAVVQQSGVNAVDPELGRDVQLDPEPVFGLVGRPGYLISVIPVRQRRSYRGYVDGYDRTSQQHSQRYGQQPAGGALSALRPRNTGWGDHGRTVHREMSPTLRPALAQAPTARSRGPRPRSWAAFPSRGRSSRGQKARSRPAQDRRRE